MLLKKIVLNSLLTMFGITFLINVNAEIKETVKFDNLANKLVSDLDRIEVYYPKQFKQLEMNLK